MNFIPNQWYPVIESIELKKKPLAVERLAKNLVFWRADRQVFCFEDRCPHLGAALSQGKIVNQRLICPFHGFEFGEKGQCLLIPANGPQGKIPKGMQAQSYPTQEAYGMIWIWWGEERQTYPPLPFFEELQDWSYTTTQADWPVHISRAIENQLDVAHIPFVHHNTIGKGMSSFIQGPLVEDTESEIKVWNARDKNSTRPLSQKELRKQNEGRPADLHFLFPGIWRLYLGSQIRNLIFFVPINQQHTRYYLRMYYRFPLPLIVKPIAHRLMNLSNRIILNQDRKMVMGQRPYNSAEADEEHFIAADRAILKYRKHSRQLIEKAQHNGKKGESSLPMHLKYQGFFI